jgi:hypothetical protein
MGGVATQFDKDLDTRQWSPGLPVVPVPGYPNKIQGGKERPYDNPFFK